MKVQYGSGPKGFDGWVNFDCSPALVVQRIPIISFVAKRTMPTVFDDSIRFGDTRTGLPLKDNSVDYLYCSHVLEHLSLEDFRRALRDSFRVLKPGAVFRGVMPDMETWLAGYLNDSSPDACSKLWEISYMASVSRPRGVMGLLRTIWGNSRHLWLWDYKGTKCELEAAGFIGVRRAQYGDSEFAVFGEIEEKDRWDDQLGFECRKP